MKASDGENGADDRDEKQAVLNLLMLNHIHAVIMEYLLLNSCVWLMHKNICNNDSKL